MRERRLNTREVQATRWPTVDRFLQTDEIPQGYLTVVDNEVPIDLFYKSKGADTTVVCFHGAVQHDVRIPWLIGGGVLRDAEANRLSISDPNLHLYGDAQNTWFLGSEQTPYLQDRLYELIGCIAEITGTEHLVFFGGSSGGFAALAMSHRFPGSLALPMNPQTVLARHHHMVDRYLGMAWPGVNGVAELPDHVVTDLASLYGDGYQNTIGYVQNLRDRFHIKAHQQPFFDHVAPDRLLLMTGEWGRDGDNGHIMPPKTLISRILGEVAASDGRWDEALALFDFTSPTY